ncbi:hypothetical protein D9757_002252 [Collybiopsis confluens]|uniref:DRBM domain-containing protein n=1 Tax=Collybiopsis confluens TaxID=2823264 RepID=A0A8H5I059_9AGAR|nr:hypothetical protein D9757_002252 [Collybiopsis confluens]
MKRIMGHKDFQTPGRSPGSLSFEEKGEGPSDKAVWTVTCKVNNVQKGIGTASNKAEARNLASKEALQVSVDL